MCLIFSEGLAQKAAKGFRLLNSAKKNGIKRFINTSTSEVYGTAQEVPIPESHPINAQSPYSCSRHG